MTDVERMRAEFFRRTRKGVVVLYAVCGVAAAALGAGALAADAGDGLLGFAGALGVALVLFWVGPMLKTSAKGARTLVAAAPLAGVLAAQLLDVGDVVSNAAVAGAIGGFALGMGLGIAALRRRLARDDELLLRQKRLGFDPEEPMGWLRSR